MRMVLCRGCVSRKLVQTLVGGGEGRKGGTQGRQRGKGMWMNKRAGRVEKVAGGGGGKGHIGE